MTPALIRSIVTKLGRAALTIFVMVTGVFVLLRHAGDPVSVFLGPDASPEMKAAYSHQLGLDQPLFQQFERYIHSILGGHFGVSYVYHKDALSVVLDHLGLTLALSGTAFALALVVGLAAGITAAVRRGSRVDRMLTAASSAGLCIPGFFLALLLMLLFSITLRWLPTNGSGTWRHLVLPAVTIAAASSAVLARYTRAALVETLDEPFVTAARTREIPFWRILFHHALPAAAIPILTVLGFLVGGLVTGSIVVETVFAWPGMGNLFITSIGNRDIPIVQAVVILAGTAMVLTNLVVDLLYVVVDPRVRRNDCA